MALITTFARVTPEDLYPRFDKDNPPDPGPYWDSEVQEVSEEWNQQMLRWETAERYQRYHSRKHVSVPHAYEMPTTAKDWADEIASGDAKNLILVLYGGVGAGKTHSACAIACYLAALWTRPQFTDAPPLLVKTASMLFSGLKNFGGGDPDELRRHALNTKVLVLDDLTRAEIKAYDVESLGQILDTRTQQGLPSVLTLNHELIERALEGLPPFLASRIEGGRMVPVFGPDRRKEGVA